MRFYVRVSSFSLAVLLCLCAGCNYAAPAMDVSIANRSGEKLQNLVVSGPKGTFGLPELRDGQTHRRTVPIASPCKFSVTFRDGEGKTYSADYDLGEKCPVEQLFEVGAGMKISSRPGRP